MTIALIIESRPRDVVTVRAEQTVREAVALLSKHRIGAVPVLDGSDVAGIFSERDLVYCVAEHGPEVLDWRIDRVMTTPAVTVDRQTPILGALALMTERRIRHLPVVDQDGMAGFVSIGDLVKHRIDSIESDAAGMRTYIQGA